MSMRRSRCCSRALWTSGAVIGRKVPQCSKNKRGARTYGVMKSITATMALRGHQVSSALADMISGRSMPQAVAR
ncbi:MAG: hypothetical protein JWM59_5049 [Verrucomicrobiales bacterium]|nr:hypothetical protein [Verrucomicrobiales bacterium]